MIFLTISKSLFLFTMYMPYSRVNLNTDLEYQKNVNQILHTQNMLQYLRFRVTEHDKETILMNITNIPLQTKNVDKRIKTK